MNETEKVELIYQAIRKAYGYDEKADELVDFMYGLMDDHERVEKGA